jgi:uncharacterized protein (TIGR03790 family)
LISRFRYLLPLATLALFTGARAEGLVAARLAVIFNLDDAASSSVARYYATQREIPAENILGIHLPSVNVLQPNEFGPIRQQLLDRLPVQVQSLLLVWSKPYAVGCMSITSAFAAGYRGEFCPIECARTPLSPLFDSDGWLPADTVGWWPAMLLPSDDARLAHELIRRGMEADSGHPPGTLYLVRTADRARNVRASTYPYVQELLAHRLRIVQLSAPVTVDVADAIGYFTGAMHVEELPRVRFRPGAAADHLTSSGGRLEGGSQMSALAWLQQGATASYGSVSEPCALLEKFPNVEILFEHYIHGETLMEAYWKSVAMPGQGLFIGEPLARPYQVHGS